MPTIQPPLILVVDDEGPIVSLLTEVLEDEGYMVRFAIDGRAALDEIDRQTPDLVVADVMMPRLDGLSLASQLQRRMPPLPVILMSAAVTPRSQGISFIAKPFDIDYLLDMISRILHQQPNRAGDHIHSQN